MVWTKVFEGRTSADRDRVYRLLTDVTTWPSWNAGVAGIEIEGPFRAGAAAKMTFPDGSQLPFSITWAQPGQGYEDLTAVPDAGVVVRVRHELHPEDSQELRAEGKGTRIVYRCMVTGSSAEACAKVGEQVSADFEEVIAALAARAES